MHNAASNTGESRIDDKIYGTVAEYIIVVVDPVCQRLANHLPPLGITLGTTLYA